MSTDLNKLAVDAEADRLSGVYIRVVMLARAERIDLLQAGRNAIAKGLVSAADWGCCERPWVGGSGPRSKETALSANCSTTMFIMDALPWVGSGHC